MVFNILRKYNFFIKDRRLYVQKFYLLYDFCVSVVSVFPFACVKMSHFAVALHCFAISLSQKTIWRVFCCMINVPPYQAVQIMIK